MHLGRVHLGIIETLGNISLFFYPDSEVKMNLPVLPELFKNQSMRITNEEVYACTFCGYTETLKPKMNIPARFASAKNGCRLLIKNA